MDARDAVTIRFPSRVLAEARELKADGESLNDLVVKAVDREVRRRRGLRAHEGIVAIRAQIRARTGVQPDSVPLIRALREGEGRRD